MERLHLQKFIKKSLLFLPIVIVLGFCFLVVFISGEATPINTIISKHKNQKEFMLLGLAYSNPTQYFKMRMINELKSDVLVLGNSRSMKFRAVFFKENISFYNAGGAIVHVGDFRNVLKRIDKEAEPDLIIVGLDHSMFNPVFNSRYANTNDAVFDKLEKSKISFIMRKLLIDYLKNKKFLIKDLFDKDNINGIGMNALINNDGFRNDGSKYDGWIIKDPLGKRAKSRFDKTQKEILNGIKRFPYSDHVDQATLNELNLFLTECKQRGIGVIGFLPPFAPAAYQAIKEMGEKQSYIFKLAPKLRSIFSEFQYDLFDFTNLSALNASPEEAIDGYHGSEKAYLRLFIRMIENHDGLSHFAKEKDYLKNRLYNTLGHFIVFSNNE